MQATTPREEIAKLALEAAAGTRGVAAMALDPAGRWATRYAQTTLAGVVCLPLASGGYALELHLIARWVPLLPLADEIRRRIDEAIKRQGLAGELRRIDVAFEDLESGELAVG